MQTNEANRAFIQDELRRLRESLGAAEASPVERLLIDQVVVCHLRMHLTEQWYQSAMQGCSLPCAAFCERKLSAVQRRYLRAIETLSRVRTLIGVPLVQVNIASGGAQQLVKNG